MSKSNACTDRSHKPAWVVLTRKGNRSAFNGYRFVASEYSEVVCLIDNAVWRTRGAYVDHLVDMTDGPCVDCGLDGQPLRIDPQTLNRTWPKPTVEHRCHPCFVNRKAPF